MKLKDLPFLPGIKPEIKKYGFDTTDFALPVDGKHTVVLWLHPKAGKTEIQQADVDALRNFLKPGDVAIDIGAYTGDTVVPMAIALGKTGTVLALEPNKYVFPVLEKMRN